MTTRPPTLRIDPADQARLADQARALGGEGGAGLDRAALQVVTFRLGDQACAAPAHAIERAVTRLGATTEVPLAGGGARPVAWVDEQPVAVTDLAALAGLAPRPPAALARAPALLVATPAGVAALAVDGPLELAEAPLELAAGAALADLPGLGVAGRLVGGAALLSADCLRARAGGHGAP